MSNDGDRISSSMRRHGLRLGLFALGTALLLALVNVLTSDRITEQRSIAERTALAAVLPPTLHDNDLLESTFAIDPQDGSWNQVRLLGLPTPRQAYRSQLEGRPNGVILPVETAEGYSGTITLLVGIDVNGTLTGVRVLQHNETPGLGDKIELRKDDWILGFDGLSRTDPGASGWQVRKDGGDFDQFVGATITPRAVVAAVYNALQFFDLNRDALLAP